MKGEMKGILLLLLYIVYGTSGSELYRALNISCYEKDELTCDPMDTSTAKAKVDCALPSIVDETVKDDCAGLYQLIAPKTVLCKLASRGLRPHLQHLYSEWWSDSPLVSPSRLSYFLFNIKQSLIQHFLVDAKNGECFSATDILESQGLSTRKCFSQSSVGKFCSAIVDRLTRGESICDGETFDDVSCVNDAVKQLFDVLTVNDDTLTLTELHTLIGSRHRSVREEDHGDHEDEDDHDHDNKDDHDHDDDNKDGHDHDHEDNQCITESRLMEEFNEVAEDLGLMNTMKSLGISCHGHEGDNDTHTHDDHMDDDHMDDDIKDGTNCSAVYNVCHDLILKTGLTTRACLAGNGSHKDDHDHDDDDDGVSHSEAYGYGFLSTAIISLASQIGVITILFTFSNQMAKYLISVMIAIGISSLVSDAILHLIPVAFEEEEEGDGHDHGDDGGHGHSHSQTTIWRGVCLLGAILLFYLFEVTLGLLKKKLGKRNERNRKDSSLGLTSKSTSNIPLQEVQKQPKDVEEQEHKAEQKSGCLNFQLQMDVYPPYYNPNQGFCHGIVPVAWMIILGDALHNFADGLAIGVSFTSSLGIGASTSIAILFHEIPHEFGDFAILLSSGMKWYVALMYNFLSAVIAIIGMLVGVGIGHASEDSTPWVLAFAAGVFLYVALVDLFPGLMEILDECKSLKSHLIYMVSHLVGFMIGFLILLLIAIYEEDLNSLID